MASRKQDLLGQLIDTALQPDDYDPMMDSDGNTGLYVPADASIADDTEEDDAFEALREDLSPGEAQEVASTMRPLSPQERHILETTPGLKGLTRVDDAEHEDWMIENSHGGYKALDPLLDDAIYGDSQMNNNEEKMERLGIDSDSGWGFSSLKKLGKKAYKYGKKGITTPLSYAKRAALTPAKFALKQAKRFMPNRDRAKALLVKNLYKKLWVEHANWLGIQDQKMGLPLQPLKYAQVSKMWATAQVKKGGLPTKFVVGKDEILGADILGSDVMGSWYNPFSWFSEKSQIIVNQTQGARSPVGPDGQPLPEGENPEGMDPNAVQPPSDDPNAAPADAQAPSEDADSQGDSDMTTGISGDDSLGAFATEILGGFASPQQRASAKADQFLTLVIYKLKSGKPLSPREVAQIAAFAKQGNPKAIKIYKTLLKAGAAVAGDDLGAWVHKLNPAYWTKSKEERMLIDFEREQWNQNARLQKQLARKGQTLGQAERAKAAAVAVARAKAETSASDAQLKQIEAAIMGDDSGAWAHVLNPFYWLKSKEERKLTDIEKEKWIENAKLQKELGKRQETLAQAERAKTAAEAVQQAKAQAAATEAQLKAIEASISGELIRDLNADVNGTFVGHEKPTAVTKVVLSALDKTGKRAIAQALYNKIAQGQPLTPAELKEARGVARLLNRVKVVHGDLISGESDPVLAMHGAFVGACILGGIDAARARNAKLGKAADHLCNRIASGETLSPVEKRATVKLITETQKLRNFTKTHVSGAAFVGHSKATKLRGAAFVGAVKVMSEADKKMLAEISALAKSGNPRAIKALAELKKSGEIMGGDFIGFSLKSAFKYATAPIWLPAYGAYKGAKWTGRKLGITKGGSASPEQVRLAKLKAARQRAIAAQAKARAADAQTEAELRAQEAIASAAEAEAQAADAEALQKEAAMRTAEIEANPDMATSQEDDGDSSGEFVGGWTDILGKGTKSAKIVAKASEKSATGMKIRSGAKMYKKVAAGDPKAKAALKTMIAKANKGDPQAKRDLNAIWVGRVAVKAKQKAQKRQAAVLAHKARKLKVIAAQRKLEARIATKLVRTERKMQLKHYAKVETQAAKGNKKAIVYVAKQAAAAKKGDKKAQARINAMKLGRSVRMAAPTKRERRNLIQAKKTVERARRNDPKALRQIAIVKAAAKQGNPNAKRALKRYQVVAPVVAAVATGMLVGKSKKTSKKKHTTDVAAVKKAQLKLKAGTGTREEFAAGARAAQAMGDKQTAGELAVAAASAPSATQTLQKAGAVYTAKEAGNVEAKAAVDKTFEEAKAGDPTAIKKMGNVLAVQTIDDINKGKPVSQTMTDAVNLQQRAAAGDPAAIETLKTVSAEATKPNPIPEATAAAIAASAAAVTVASLAAKPKAKAEFLAKVNPPMDAAEKGSAEAEVNTLLAKAKEGTITPEEGDRGIRLAERLGKPAVAAQISSMAPPMERGNPLSSLPDMPLAPISGVWDLFKESLKALTLTTRDPLANYRGGIASRAKERAAEPVSSSGWSPFAYFRSIAPWIAPLASTTAAAASISNLIASKQRKAAPTPAPAPAPASVPVQTVTQTPSESAPATAPAVQGESAVDPEGLAEIDARLEAEKKAQIRKQAKKPTSSSGAESKSFKDYITTAIKTKKMSKSEFNKAMDVHLGAKHSKESRIASGEKILKFLAGKGVKVES
jgi:hypothetical protein